MLAGVKELRALQARARDTSARSGPRFERRGQLLPRQRLALLLDAGAPFLDLCSLAGFMRDNPDPAKSVPGCSSISGIGYVAGVRCLVTADDAGIAAGAAQPRGGDKFRRL